MALIRYNRYPGRFASATSSYPQGAFKNKSGPGAKDGSYAEADWLNDWAGFFGRLLIQAGISANGTVDSAQSSQYYDALAKLFPLASGFTGSLDDTGFIAIPITIGGKTTTFKLNWAPWSGTTATTGVNGVYEITSRVIVTWKSAFTSKVLAVIPSVADVPNQGMQESAWYVDNSLTTTTLLAGCRQAGAAMSGYVFAIGY